MELDDSPYLIPVTLIGVIVILLIGAVVLYRYGQEIPESVNESLSGNGNCDSFDFCELSPIGTIQEPIISLRPYMKYVVLIIFIDFIMIMFLIYYIRFGRVKKGEIS